MKSKQVRQTFIDYFKKQGHTPVASSSLIPENDATLLFANAGMNQFKNAFLGLETRDYKRAVTSQKCVRAGGKHNDLENVGFTARHHTFFEMLGNFSFGDYFKKDAIHFAWDLLTKELQIPKERLYVTVFETDDEAADIWNKQEGVPRERIYRFGEKDNFWRMGDTGPCGPCSEIFYDHGPEADVDPKNPSKMGGDGDRFVEIWNLVFMQYNEDGSGRHALPKPSVDTGGGLERWCAALQGQPNNYDTDLFLPIIHKVAQLSKKEYVSDIRALEKNALLKETTAAMRVLADHSRAAAFLIADGVLPSNEGRGYVLRRILRRAIRYGRKLTDDPSLLPTAIGVVIEEMHGFYPELLSQKTRILTNVTDEVARFLSTLDQGTAILHDNLGKLTSKGQKTVDGETVFRLYDTFGFPVDLTRLMAVEKGFDIDEAGFEKRMSEARQKAKASWKGKALTADAAHLVQLAQEAVTKSGPTVFEGYTKTRSEGRVLVLSNGQKICSELKAGETGLLIVNKTPFYAEGGGQVGDSGTLSTSTGAEATISNCTKQNDIFIHHVHVTAGTLKAQDTVDLQVLESDRRNTTSNHSATHLLHAALRQTLGAHVTQAGSLVEPDRLRFDFTHGKPLSSHEIMRLETLVNDEIAKGIEVSSAEMPHAKALEAGALALFGEKYGDKVRVIKMGDFSCELCGGTHVSNTAMIRTFKIVSEGGVSSGVRRIEALTGEKAVAFLMKNTRENLEARAASGLNESWNTYLSEESSGRVSDILENKNTAIKSLEKEIKQLKGGKIDVETLLQSAHPISRGRLIAAHLEIDDRDSLSQIVDKLKDKLQSGVVALVGKGDKTHPVIVAVTKDLNPQLNAGKILSELASHLGGKGGGRPDFAQGAVPDLSQIESALAKLRQL